MQQEENYHGASNSLIRTTICSANCTLLQILLHGLTSIYCKYIFCKNNLIKITICLICTFNNSIVRPKQGPVENDGWAGVGNQVMEADLNLISPSGAEIPCLISTHWPHTPILNCLKIYPGPVLCVQFPAFYGETSTCIRAGCLKVWYLLPISILFCYICTGKGY